MEESRQEDDPMDIEQPEHPSLPSTAYGSPSYSPPEPDEYTKEGRDVKNDYDAPEEGENKQERTTRNKAKGKAKVFLSEEENDGDDDDDEEEEERAARYKAKGKARAYVPIEDSDNDNQERTIGLRRPRRPNPLSLHPTAAGDTEMDMDAYWARQCHEIQFGDADAAMNETLSSPSPSPPSSENNENDPYTTPEPRNPLYIRRNFATLDMPSMMNKLTTLQQQQASGGWGRGRGRGKGQGWGLEWKETMTQEKVEHEGWSFYEDPHPSPVEEETRWEFYDASAWENATEKAEKQEVGKVTLKLPSVKRGEGSKKRATDPNTVTNENPKGQSMEFVRAVRDYQAIVRGNYLSYEKGDVMKVLYRDSDGKVLLDLSRDSQRYTLYSHSGKEHSSPFSLSKTRNGPVRHIQRTSYSLRMVRT